jgi:hypothetical protein
MKKLILLLVVVSTVGCCIPWHGQTCTAPKKPTPPPEPEKYQPKQEVPRG